MRAVFVHKPDLLTAAIPKHDQVLAEDADRLRQFTQFAGDENWMPETPQILTARRAWTHPRNFIIDGHRLGLLIAAEILERGLSEAGRYRWIHLYVSCTSWGELL